MENLPLEELEQNDDVTCRDLGICRDICRGLDVTPANQNQQKDDWTNDVIEFFPIPSNHPLFEHPKFELYVCSWFAARNGVGASKLYKYKLSNAISIHKTPV